MEKTLREKAEKIFQNFAEVANANIGGAYPYSQIIDCIEKGLQEAIESKWIPVSETPPQSGKMCLFMRWSDKLNCITDQDICLAEESDLQYYNHYIYLPQNPPNKGE